ncbi:MAG: ribosome-associated heat shock protein Hsp15 [Psychrobium sp.]|nr:ribosome-associated heat shock protein Hsp15 [Psychrobium sp.]
MKSSQQAANSTSVRLDKWLWAARFYKTRGIARDIVSSGKVSYNGQRCKPSKNIELGAMIKLRQGNEEKEVEILQLSDQRRGAPQAQLLYQETDNSIKVRAQNAELRRLHALDNPHPEKRPDKKQRRKIIQFQSQ